MHRTYRSKGRAYERLRQPNLPRGCLPSRLRYIPCILCFAMLGQIEFVSERSHTTAHRPKDTIVWSTDLHAGPIGCQIEMFASIGVPTFAEIDFPNCHFFHDAHGRNLCVDPDSGGLRFDDWRGFSLDPNAKERSMFLSHFYQSNENFKRTNTILCSHPAANCEIYLPFREKSIIIYNTQRIEFGRDDRYVWWRKPYYANDSKLRWQIWVSHLKDISDSKRNLVAANNMYDKMSMEYLTGVRTRYIPSWCGSEDCNPLQKSKYKPVRQEVVLVPYRTNLVYSRAAIPEDGWPNVKEPSHNDPLEHAIFEELRALQADSQSVFNLISVPRAFPPTGKFQSVCDFLNFKAVIFIPYVPSTMFFFQIYRANVPILAPTQQLLATWIREHRILWETTYGFPERLSTKFHSQLPHPSRFDAESRIEWFSFYDIYNTESFPFISYFNNWTEAAQIVKRINFAEVSFQMMRHNSKEFKRIRKIWLDVFRSLAHARSLPV